MVEYNSQAKPTPLTWGDLLEGTAQLATSGIVEITEVVEAMHAEIVLRPFQELSPHVAKIIHENTTGKIYHTIKQFMRFSGDSTAKALRHINNELQDVQQQTELTDNFKRVVNVVNGLMGDHLVAQDNPLALPMMLYDRYGNLYKNTQLSGRVVILIHGLCLSYHCWNPGSDIGLGEHIVYSMPNTTILHLDYNTGKRISQNGHAFSELLEKLAEQNPDISEINLIGHSMGGLVGRSAIFYGKQDGKSWLSKVNNYIALGSPHHGAVLERLGYILQDSLSRVPIAGNIAHLADLRSAGIIDLRHGSIRDDDWQTVEKRTGLVDDLRKPAPLPSSINAFLVACSLETKPKKHQRDFIGDGLVSVTSALGEHAGDHDLKVPEAHKAIFYGINHMNVTYHPLVRNQVIKWLKMSQEEKDKKGSRTIIAANLELQRAC